MEALSNWVVRRANLEVRGGEVGGGRWEAKNGGDAVLRAILALSGASDDAWEGDRGGGQREGRGLDWFLLSRGSSRR